MKEKKTLTLKTLNKSNIWDIQENDVFRMWEQAEKDTDLRDNQRHYIDVIRSAFEMEEVKVDKPEIIKKYEMRGYKVGTMRMGGSTATKWAIKKKPIMRVTDLTYENIHHISASKLMEVLERNFGGGWESLSQSIRDIIESGFDISTTTLPADRLKKEGGMYQKKIKDGYEVLEIPKGTWIEAIFAKEKPEAERIHIKFNDAENEKKKDLDDDDNDDEEEAPVDDNYNRDEEDDDDQFDDDKLTEESYRTTFEENPEDLGLEAEETPDEDEENY